MSKPQAVQDRIDDLISKIEVVMTAISSFRLQRGFVLRSMGYEPVEDGYASLCGALDEDISQQLGPMIDEALSRSAFVHQHPGAAELLAEQSRRYRSRIAVLLGEYEILHTTLTSLEIWGLDLPGDAETQRMGRQDLIRVLESAAPALRSIGQDFNPAMPIGSMRALVAVLREASP